MKRVVQRATVTAVFAAAAMAPMSGVALASEAGSVVLPQPYVKVVPGLDTGTSLTIASLSESAPADDKITFAVSGDVTASIPAVRSGGSWRASGVTFSGLEPDRSYRIAVRAVDSAGRRSEPATRVVTTDVTPPPAPTGLTYTVPPGASLGTLTWDHVADNLTASDDIVYRLYWNGRAQNRYLVSNMWGDTAAVDFQLEVDCAGFAADGDYTLTAIDESGLESAPSAPIHLDLWP